MVQSFILIDALSSACWEKKRKEKRPGALHPGPEAKHALLAVPDGILQLLGAIKG
jgi:hypothetical protein